MFLYKYRNAKAKIGVHFALKILISKLFGFPLAVFSVTMHSIVGIVVVGILYLISISECLLRNDITDRCLHIGVVGNDEKESLYSASCNWNNADNSGNDKTHPDEWIEIIVSEQKNDLLDQRTYFNIRKITNTSEMCLVTTTTSSPDISTNCNTQDSLFQIDLVTQKTANGVPASRSSFKIRNIHGKCLTVQPGQAVLKFKDCLSRQGLFQVWSVCRHNKKCDVDFTWSPRHILFPPNGTDVSGTEYMLHAIKGFHREPNNELTSTNYNTHRESSSSMIINEVLYTVQNALRIYENSDPLLINGIGAFYTKETLSEASALLQNICKEGRSNCFTCTQCTTAATPPNRTVAWMMKWMEECNTSPNPIKTFLSTDVLQVPYHLFPSHDEAKLRESSMMEKYKLIIPNLRRYLKELEANLQVHAINTSADVDHPEQQYTKQGHKGSPVENVLESKEKQANKDTSPEKHTSGDVKGVGGQQNGATNQTDSNKEMNATTQDYAAIIDIRLFNG